KFRAKNGEYSGKLILDKGKKMSDQDLAKEIISKIDSNIGVINSKVVTKSKEYAPKLFSLTSLQGFITSKYASFTSDKVLSICQNLYEGKGKGGYITYPRTDSVYLEESLVGKVEKTLNIIKKGHPCEANIKFSKSKRVFDSSKVESHSAIIPTYIIPPSSLSKDESIVYEAIRDRFLANFMPPAEYENTEIITDVDKYKFQSKGKVLKVMGYLDIYGKSTSGNLLPLVEKGEEVDVLSINPVEKVTSPPKPYTEDSLLKAMKNCGKNVPEDDTSVLSGYSIGTSATRADVLKKIGQVGYVKKKGKSYSITELGINLVEIFPVEDLFDVDFTGKLEKSLFDIQKGNFSRKDYLNMICKFIYDNVNKIKFGPSRSINTDKKVYNPKTKKFVKESSFKARGSETNLEDSKAKKNTLEKGGKISSTASRAPKKTKEKTLDQETGLEIIAVCPECGASVLESPKAFSCKNYRQCGFTIWKNDTQLASYNKKPNKTMVRSLAKKGEASLKGLQGIDGNKFEAKISYTIG
ncbi:MAG: type IA DNA topoisomerase, partial [Peptostreptococcus sp.]|nr:type IA DNA topoisomerase [Peptostreptococcus sp.]